MNSSSKESPPEKTSSEGHAWPDPKLSMAPTMDKLMFGVSAQCGYRRFGLTVPLVLARIEAALPSISNQPSDLVTSPICGKYLNKSDIFYRCR